MENEMKQVLNRTEVILIIMMVITAGVMQGCGLCSRPGDRITAEKQLQKGIQHEKDSLYSLAAEAYKMAIDADPEYRDAHFQLGNLYDRIGLLDHAQAAFERVLKINRSDAEAFNNLGNIFGQKGNVKEAIRYYQQAIEINDSLPAPHYNLAQSYLLQKNFKDAETELRKAYQYAPDDSRYAESLGLFYISQNKFHDAVIVLKDAKKSKNVKPSVHLHLSAAHRGKLEYDQAIAELETYLSLLSGEQEKTIITQQVRELKKEKYAHLSAELRKKVSK